MGVEFDLERRTAELGGACGWLSFGEAKALAREYADARVEEIAKELDARGDRMEPLRVAAEIARSFISKPREWHVGETAVRDQMDISGVQDPKDWSAAPIDDVTPRIAYGQQTGRTDYRMLTQVDRERFFRGEFPRGETKIDEAAIRANELESVVQLLMAKGMSEKMLRGLLEPKPKTREQVLEEALREISEGRFRALHDAEDEYTVKAIARRALEVKP